MHTRVVATEFSTSQGLPEVDMLLALSVGWLSSHNPSVGSLAVSANTDIGVKAKAKKQVAKQNCVVFRVSTSLKAIKI